jgi:hypothetical protein
MELGGQGQVPRGQTVNVRPDYRVQSLPTPRALSNHRIWQLGSLAKTDAPRLQPILATFLVAYAALAVNSYAYFFWGPVIAEIFIAACLGLAMVTAKSQAAAYAGTAQRA